MSYITKNFLLSNKQAIEIYDSIKSMPICDYHCHLNEKEILEDRPFEDLFEVTLKYDHYKWRLMRFAGVSEDYITGNKSPKEKWIKYCEVLQSAFGNPLYHWTQLELLKYFNCDLEINSKNAEKIWNECNSFIKENKLSPIKVINSSNVKIICTTNKMFDDLSTFKKINSKGLNFNVYPTYRPDDFLYIENSNYYDLIGKTSSKTLKDLEKFLECKIDEFIKAGCKLADISISNVCKVASYDDANKIFLKAMNKEHISNLEASIFKGYFVYFLLKLISKKGLAAELHLEATRNNNTKMFNSLGCDSGFDAISEENTIDNLKNLLDTLNNENSLGRIIIFNLNQKDNKQLITLIGSFTNNISQIQCGPAWWFLDNLEGIKQQLKDLSSLGHLGSFIGMLTDSRSFLSYERHQYFRRILSSYLGEMMEKGLISQDIKIVKEIAQNISYTNSIKYLQFEGVNRK